MGHPRVDHFGASVRAVRTALGLTQRGLARRIGRAQSYVSMVERGLIQGLSIAEADAISRSLGGTLVIGIEAPVLVAGSRQRDAAHARCVAYVARRLVRDGWVVQREVQVGSHDRPGWIDVLAFNPRSRVLLIIEVKTELVDLGGLERQLGWYEREARRAAMAFGWQAAAVMSAALLLSTKATDDRLRENTAGIRQAFPHRWRDLMSVLHGDAWIRQGRALALIGPRSRVRDWCRPTVLDGRRSAAPYRNIADFLQASR